MQDTRNLIFAIVLSTLILFCWQYFYAGPRLIEAQKQAELLHSKIEASKPAAVNLNKTSQETDVTVPQERTDVIKKESRIQINTPKLHGSISLKGARFDDLTLAEYKETEAPDSKEVALLSPTGSEGVYFAEFGWISADKNTSVPDSQTIWHSKDTTLEVGKPVTLSWDNNAGLKFITTISVDDNYMFQITRRIENYGKASESVLPYGILNRAAPIAHKSFYILHEGALGVFDGVLNEVRYKDMKENKKQEINSKNGWLGITDKYWLTAIIPDQNSSFSTNFNYFHINDQDRFQTDYLGQKYNIEQGQSIETTSHLFAGAKKLSLLEKYSKDLNIALFDRAVDFGNLYFITKPLFKLLTYFHHLLGNFGLAILLLTISIKLLMFPLANKSYVSMHHLKRLQPQILEVKEHYKNDKAQLNKNIMELYKTEKVNPMAGCLPLLIQIPIFFALYKVLFITIEMRHAPFYGWIKDLSAPDPTSIFNLFGLIPFNPPAMLMVGAWPVIMGITMIMQQRMNPQPADPVQAKVMKMLPFIFVFLFNTFPAGLIIYWAWNNTLSVLQQWVITRQLPQS
jgi:YidC/Oxa1 family membrane protein insertase